LFRMEIVLLKKMMTAAKTGNGMRLCMKTSPPKKD